jgi:hypothetical protein
MKLLAGIVTFGLANVKNIRGSNSFSGIESFKYQDPINHFHVLAGALHLVAT